MPKTKKRPPGSRTESQNQNQNDATPTSRLPTSQRSSVKTCEGVFRRWRDYMGALKGATGNRNRHYDQPFRCKSIVKTGLLSARLRSAKGCSHCFNHEGQELAGGSARLDTEQDIDNLSPCLIASKAAGMQEAWDKARQAA